MAISANAITPNLTIQAPGLSIYSGVVQCAFKGNGAAISRDTLAFIITDPRITLAIQPPEMSCVVSPASIAYDGAVNDSLWAVDGASVTTVNEDRGSGTAQLQVYADLAVRGANDIILRVNYTVFVRQ